MNLAATPLGTLLEQIAAKTPTPGGGAVASAVGALSAALAGMVVSYSAGKKNLAQHEPALQEARSRLERARGLFLMLAEEDAAAFGLVNELSRLPEGDPRRAAEMPAAVLASVRVPEATMAASVDILRLMVELAGITNRHLRSDLGIAAELAEAAARSSAWNVLINAGQLPEGEAATARARCQESLSAARGLRELVAEACRV